MKETETILQSILDKAVDNRSIFGLSFCIKFKDFFWCGNSGNLDKDTQFFIASTTKLFTTAVILKLCSKRIIAIDDSISKYLDKKIVEGLNIFKGKDYSDQITIKNLLSHTSGIPDYFEEKNNLGKSLKDELISGKDQSWTFEQIISFSKTLKSHFIPSSDKKAYYSDTNYQLLGKIIENVTNKSINDNYIDYIFKPLGLSKTYLYLDENDKNPKNLYFKSDLLFIPKAMSSFGPDGGIVSTSGELLRFIESFFNGSLFPLEYINQLNVFNKIFFPFEAGIGIERIALPFIFSPFVRIPSLIGYFGLSGTLAFSDPKEKFFISGTINQIAYPMLAIQIMIKLVTSVLKNY